MKEELALLQSMSKEERLELLLDGDIDEDTQKLETLMDEIQFFGHEIELCKQKARDYIEDEDERAAEYAEFASTFTKHRVELRTQVREVRERIRWLRRLKRSSNKSNSKEQSDS